MAFRKKKALQATQPVYKRVYDSQWKLLGKLLMDSIMANREWDPVLKKMDWHVDKIMDDIMRSEWLQNEKDSSRAEGVLSAQEMLADLERLLDSPEENGDKQ